MENYEEFVVKNISLVGGIESGLRTLLLFLLPNRVSNDQVYLEGCHSLLSLFSWFNDVSVLHFISSHGKKLESSLEGNGDDRTVSIVNSSTQESIDFPSKICAPYAKWHTLVSCGELLAEMFAKSKFGEKAKYQTALFIEFIKVLIKLSLFIKLKGRLLLQSDLFLPSLRDYGVIQELSTKTTPPKIQKRRRLQVDPNKLQQFQEVKGNNGEVLKGGSPNPGFSTIIAELLFLIRPLVYLSSILKYGDKSWIPLLSSLFMDLCSLRLHSKSTEFGDREKAEMIRRLNLLFFYFLRNPLFDKVTIKLLGGRNDPNSKKSWFGNIMSFVRDYVEFYQDRYFYTSAT